MVSLWPWKGEDTSAAAFEKSLAALADKITNSQAQLDFLRYRLRKWKALWTLYTSLAYMLCAIVLSLVVGIKALTIIEYAGLVGGPVVIYIVRRAITAYYQYRISTVQARLEERQAERTATIEKLKTATKYNSTQQLLEKYGAAPVTPKSQQTSPKAKRVQKSPVVVQRTGIAPPATANIPRPQVGIPQHGGDGQSATQAQPRMSPRQVIEAHADFAPNAFSSRSYANPRSVSSTAVMTDGKWYDRILDVLLGEDETNPKNRVVLICQTCRLVNGQAPPGIRSLADIGRWKCAACGAMNGVEDEARKVLEEIKVKMGVETVDGEEEMKGREMQERAKSGEVRGGELQAGSQDVTEPQESSSETDEGTSVRKRRSARNED